MSRTAGDGLEADRWKKLVRTISVEDSASRGRNRAVPEPKMGSQIFRFSEEFTIQT